MLGSEPGRLDLGIFRVSGQGAVAGLAADGGVLAPFLRVHDFAVAIETGGLAGIGERTPTVVGESAGAIVTETAEIGGNENAPQHEERGDPRGEERGDPNEMPAVAKKISHV